MPTARPSTRWVQPSTAHLPGLGTPGTPPRSTGCSCKMWGTPPFGFWQGYAQTINSGPNACAFAFNDSGGQEYRVDGSVVMAYVGPVPAHGTKTVTLTYRGM
jgi:hypothetical protein